MLNFSQEINARNNSNMLLDTLSGQLKLWLAGTFIFITEIWPTKRDYTEWQRNIMQFAA